MAKHCGSEKDAGPGGIALRAAAGSCAVESHKRIYLRRQQADCHRGAAERTAGGTGWINGDHVIDLPVAHVSTSWNATTGAHHYELERTTNVAANYTLVSANVTATSFTDNTVNSVTAYLYRVRAVDAAGNVSPYSNVDLATAISFVDDTLQVNSTTIKVAHVTQLRQAVNAVRAVTSSLSPVNWAEAISPTVRVRASHILELHSGLDGARSALGLSACAYTNAATGQVVQKEHIQQCGSV